MNKFAQAWMLLGALAGMGLTGCQSEVDIEPSAWYHMDGSDLQYCAPGPEFRLSKEAAAMKVYSDESTPASAQ